MYWNSKSCSLFFHNHWSKYDMSTYMHSHIFLQILRTCSSLVKGWVQKMLWKVALCSGDICIKILTVCVLFARMQVICCGEDLGYKKLSCVKVFPVCVHSLLVAAVMITETSVCLHLILCRTSCCGRCHRSRRSCGHSPRVCPCPCWGLTGRGSRWAPDQWWLSG